jgi:hypothetical protein
MDGYKKVIDLMAGGIEEVGILIDLDPDVDPDEDGNCEAADAIGNAISDARLATLETWIKAGEVTEQELAMALYALEVFGGMLVRRLNSMIGDAEDE